MNFRKMFRFDYKDGLVSDNFPYNIRSQSREMYEPVRIFCWESSFTVTSERRMAITRQRYPFKGPTRILSDCPTENISLLSSRLTVQEKITEVKGINILIVSSALIQGINQQKSRLIKKHTAAVIILHSPRFLR